MGADSPDQAIKPIWTTKSPGTASAGVTSPRQMSVYTDMLEPGALQKNGNQPGLNGNGGNVQPVPHTASKGSISTRSTTSQNSWEEDRSVGGEVEEVAVERVPSSQPMSKPKSPSVYETHFGSEDDLPRTVLHHPDPFLQQQQQYRPQPDLLQQPVYMPNTTPVYSHPLPRQRPSSSADHQSWGRFCRRSSVAFFPARTSFTKL